MNKKLKGKFYIEGKDFSVWLNNQRLFSLREEKLSLWVE